MRRLSPIAGIFFVFAIVFGCHRQADLSAYHGPPFTVQADAQRVTLETVVHSGGYGLNFDHAQVDDGRLNVYLTLDAPAMDELVMEAPQTLTKSFSNRARGADEVRRPPHSGAQLHLTRPRLFPAAQGAAGGSHRGVRRPAGTGRLPGSATRQARVWARFVRKRPFSLF